MQEWEKPRMPGVLAPGPVAFLPNYTLTEKLSAGLSLTIMARMLGTNLCLQGLFWLSLLCVAALLYKGMITVFAMDFKFWGVSAFAPFFQVDRNFTEADFFSADEAPEDVQQKRRAGFAKLKQKLVGKQTKEDLLTYDKIRDAFAQIRKFDGNHHVFGQNMNQLVSIQLPLVTIADRSEECFVYSGENKKIDISGAFGVNVAGHDKCKELYRKGAEKMMALSPSVLGGCVHSVTCEVVETLLRLTQLDEVSFHISGTEALRAASKMARFNTGRRLIVKLEHSYHGWTECLQQAHDCNDWPKHLITIRDQSALKFIQTRSSEIACVMYDPFMSLWASTMMGTMMGTKKSKTRSLRKESEMYRESEKTLAQQLRQVCTANKVPLIFDEVWSGFKLSIPGSAQAYCGVQGDIVTYGKAIGSGMPCGIVCGRSWLMKRFQEDRPLGSPLIAGTFVTSPATLGVLAETLEWFLLESTRKQYEAQVKVQSEAFESLNKQFKKMELPFSVLSLDLFFQVITPECGKNFQWLFQYYCCAEGITKWMLVVSNCSMEFKPEHYSLLCEKLKTAAQLFIEDGWNFDPSKDNESPGFRPAEPIPKKVNNLKEPLLA